jgi:hypothetical protein
MGTLCSSIHSQSPLAALVLGRVTFDKAAIMRRAYQEGRFALQLSRARREPASERNRMLSRFLTKAWAEAKAEARDIVRSIERQAETRAFLAERAKANAAIVAQHGGAEGLRQAIEAEHYRQHFSGARIDTLRAALSSIGA